MVNDQSCSAALQHPPNGARCKYMDQLLEEQALAIIQAHDFGSTPLFLFWSPHAPHDPMEPPDEARQRVDPPYPKASQVTQSGRSALGSSPRPHT